MERQHIGGEQPASLPGDPHDSLITYTGLGGRHIPTVVPGANLCPDDLDRVSPDDWSELRDLAKRYCRKVDGGRVRKRMDGSATVVRDGFAPYGTDDSSDDVAQDAALLYAGRLGTITATCPVAAVDESTGKPEAWHYTRQDGTGTTVSRGTIRYWAVRDAAARNGYRHDVQDLVEGEHLNEVARALAVDHALAQQQEAVWQAAYGDGSDFPTIHELLLRGGQALDLGRAGVLAGAAQALYGGTYNSSAMVRKTKQAAQAEFRELTARLDEARDALVYWAAEAPSTTTNDRESWAA